MIFNEIVICNLFSYFGEQRFDFSPPSVGRNIYLIHGRNNQGKTNFITSLKLLFCGSDNLLLRRVGLKSVDSEATLSPKMYIDGHPPHWDGIRNRKALRLKHDRFFVQAAWDEAGESVTVRRSWPLASCPRSGVLFVAAGGVELLGEEAEYYLEDRLPRELVPYFFFDGERIRELAEAGDSHLRDHIERLIDLRPVIELIEQSRESLGELSKEYADKSLVAQEMDFDAKVQQLLAEKIRVQGELEGLQDESGRILDRLQMLDLEFQRLFLPGSHVDEDFLRSNLEQINNNIEELARRFVDVATFDAPIGVNRGLVVAASERISKMLSNDDVKQRDFLSRLARVLPERLIGLPPHPYQSLTQKQEHFYRDKLARILNEMAQGIADDRSWNIGHEKLRGIHESLATMMVGAEERRAAAHEILQQMRRLRRDAAGVEQDLHQAGNMNESQRERYNALRSEQARLQSENSGIQLRIGEVGSGIVAIENKIAASEAELRRVRDRIERMAQGKRKVELLKNVLAALELYRVELRKMRNGEIENRLNCHYRELMDASQVIDVIRLDENFSPHFHDQSGREIGRLSVSAGTKQLLATALIWSLKEISGRPVPLIVDTPLARIDRQHQENLLRRFYPTVSEQVIILPTDSELDSDKLNALGSHLRQEFRLENYSGDSTRVSCVGDFGGDL